MAVVFVHRLDAEVKLLLKRQATANGRSLEAEIRDILTREVQEPQGPVTAWLEVAKQSRGTELDIPARRPARDIDLSSPSADERPGAASSWARD